MPTGINLNVITPYSSGIINIINSILVPVLIAVAFIVFLWGIYKYFVWGGENESEKAEGRKFAMWGVIGFVIILSLWGIVNLVMGAFGLSVGKAPPFPTIGGSAPSGTSGGTVSFPGAGTSVGGAGGGGGTGSNVFSSNGTLLGRTNSSGQIVNSNGQVVGRMQNGQPYTLSGTPMTGATTGSPVNQNVTTCNTDEFTLAQCESSCAGTWDASNATCSSGDRSAPGSGTQTDTTPSADETQSADSGENTLPDTTVTPYQEPETFEGTAI